MSRFYVSLQITLLSTFIFTYIARIPILMERILQIRFFKFLNLKKVKLKKDFLKHKHFENCTLCDVEEISKL